MTLLCLRSSPSPASTPRCTRQSSSDVALASALGRTLPPFAPQINSGTETIGLVIIWGHAVDGVANVIGLDWMNALGAGPNLIPKHPVNQFVVTATEALQPAGLSAASGTSWPFMLSSSTSHRLVVSVFDQEFIDDSPRYDAVAHRRPAVGLGPGSRDMLRATFGV